jgi:zinc protease
LEGFLINMKKWAKFTDKIEKHELSNGMKIALYPDKRLPEAAVSIVYHIGSKDEKEGERGYAHLFEHLMFEGSQNSQMDYFKALEKYGATINGGTSEDKTVYWEVVPSNALEYALWLESDRLKTLFPFINEERLNNQKEVVKNERRQVLESEPYGISEELLPELIFPEGHPYRHPVIGYAEDIDNATAGSMKKFFDKYYVPRNASLAVAGDFDSGKVLDVIEKYFGDIGGGKFSPPAEENIPRLNCLRSSEARDNVKLLKVYYGWPTPNMFSKEDRAIFLAVQILGRGSDSPLIKRLTIDEPICESVDVSQWSGEICGLFSVVLTLADEKNRGKAEKIIFEELAKLKNEGPKREELELIMRKLESFRLKGLERMGGFSGVAGYLSVDNLLIGDPKHFVKELELLSEIKPSDIVQSLEQWVQTDRLAKLQIIPKKEKMQSVLERPVVPPPAKYTLPQPKLLSTRSKMSVWNFEQKTIPYSTFALVLRGGATLDPPGYEGLASFTLEMLEEGAGGLTNIEISREFKKIGAVFSTSAKYSSLFAAIGVPSEFNKEAIDLLAKMFVNPDFPEGEIERVKQLDISTIKKNMNSLDVIGARAIRALLYGIDSPYGHPVPGRISSLEKIERKDVTKFYNECFQPEHTALICAGDIGSEILEMAEEKFAGFKNGKAIVFQEPAPIREGSTLYLLRKEGVASTFVSGFFHSIPRSAPEFSALNLFNSIYGGKFSSRLMRKMREEKGYTYGVHSYFTLQKGDLPWVLSAMVEKGKEAEAVEDILAELNAILGNNPPAAEEFKDAKEGFLLRYFQNFETQRDLVENIGSVFALTLPVSFYDDSISLMNKATLEEVLAVSKEVFSPEKLSFLVVGELSNDLEKLPFKKMVELKIEDFV